MAENKKSFVLYADLIHTVKKMPSDKAGLLFKKILEYVNDKDPQDEDMLVDIVFEPIKQQFKRDLVKWEDIKEIKSQSGIIGNLKRWNLEVYKQFMDKKITLEQAVEIANGRKPSQPDRTVSQTVANIAVNVNVNDTVNDTIIQTYNNTPPKGAVIDFDKFIKTFNSFANRQFTVTDKVKGSLKARLKKYTRGQVVKAIESAHQDKYHIDSNFKHLTPEFILREDKLEKYINANNSKFKTQSIENTQVVIDHSNRPII